MKKLTIPVLLALSLTSCSTGNVERAEPVPDTPKEAVRKSPLSTECAMWSLVWTVCGGWMVKWKHVIVSMAWCDYASRDPWMQIEKRRKCNGGKDFLKESWEYAKKFCDEMKYEGFEDWRLPNKDEVEQVFRDDKQTATFTNFNTNNAKYWLSSEDPSDPDSAMTAYFEGGTVRYPYGNKKSTENFVRCVREF